MGMDIHRIWTWTQFFTHGFFHGRAKTVFMDMDMDLILFNPIQTRPIAILILSTVVCEDHLADPDTIYVFDGNLGVFGGGTRLAMSKTRLRAGLVIIEAWFWGY